MSNVAKPIEAARGEIRGVLRRYRLRWEDVAPDTDEAVWMRLKPTAKKIRRGVLRTAYPALYARFRPKKG